MKFPPKHIVVPMDLSEPAHSALEAAKKLAKRCGAFLDLVYLPNLPVTLTGVGPDGLVFAAPELLENTPEFHKWRREGLKRAISGVPRSRVRTHKAQGWPAQALLNMARGKTEKWVVMGTHGYTGADHFLFGSLAEAVVRHAQVPVLTMHRRSKGLKISRILIPFNMEPYAEKALRYGVEISKKLGSAVTVLYVAPEKTDLAMVSEELRATVALATERGRAKRVKLMVCRGDPRHKILHEAQRGKFDLIVLSAHRRPFLKDYVLGSTAERVLRHSEVPVLSVPSGKSRAYRTDKKHFKTSWITDKIY